MFPSHRTNGSETVARMESEVESMNYNQPAKEYGILHGHCRISRMYVPFMSDEDEVHN